MTVVPGTDPKRSRALLITLTAVGVAILVALVVLIIVLFTRGSGTVVAATPSPSASATPTPTPTATATTKPHTTSTPTPTTSTSDSSSNNSGSDTPALSLDFSTSTGTVYCNTQAPAGQPPLALSFSWTSKGASSVYFGVSTADAQQGMLFDQLPANGSQADFSQEVDFPCPQASQYYTMTVVDDAGNKVNKSVTVTNKGDTQ